MTIFNLAQNSLLEIFAFTFKVFKQFDLNAIFRECLVAYVNLKIWLKLLFDLARLVFAFGSGCLCICTAQFLQLLLGDLLHIFIILASVNVLVLKECLPMAFVLGLALLATHFAALVTGEHNLLVWVDRAILFTVIVRVIFARRILSALVRLRVRVQAR